MIPSAIPALRRFSVPKDHNIIAAKMMDTCPVNKPIAIGGLARRSQSSSRLRYLRHTHTIDAMLMELHMMNAGHMGIVFNGEIQISIVGAEENGNLKCGE